jgi:hypothetical protein
MDVIKLGKWGTVQTAPPNMATCFEMVVSWTHCGDDMAQLARICSSAIGAVAQERLPKYRPSVHKPSEYGHICLNVMLENGIDSGSILRTGTRILQYMSEQLPNTEDVDDKADFLSETPPEDFDG